VKKDSRQSRSERAQLRAWVWAPRVGMRELDDLSAVEAAAGRARTFMWVDLTEPDQSMLTELTRCLALHPLIAEEIAERNKRAKFVLTGDAAHIVMFEVAMERHVVAREIDMVLAERFLVTSHPQAWEPLDTARLRGGIEPLLREGPDRVLWGLVDSIVDEYFPVLDHVAEQTERLQEDVLSRPDPQVLQRVFQVRRQLLKLRRALMPQREIFNQLTNRSLPLVRDQQVIYFRDVYDHLVRITDELDSDRELVGEILGAYLSQVNNNLSEVMKRLTAATVILAGVGAVAGIFGMSEAGPAFASGEANGFWFVALGVLGLGLLAWAFFRRIGWL
jgi:magnesium transporter